MKILVTGGAGYIGSHTAKLLAQRGHTPIVFDNLSTGHSEFVRWGPFVGGDICDRSAVEAVMRDHQPEAIIHFAALATVAESVRDPLRYYRTNVVGTTNLVEAALRFGIRKFVFSSSCAVYGAPDHVPIMEHNPHNPVSPYGETKSVCEKLLRSCAQAGSLGVIALRYFNAAGADRDGEIGEAHNPETHAIPLLLGAIRSGGTFQIYGGDYDTADGTCVRDYLHVEDLAAAHVLAVEKLASSDGFTAINLGGGVGTSVKQLIDLASDVTGIAVHAVVKPRREGDPSVLVADRKFAEEYLGWVPYGSDIRLILDSAWNWTRSANNPFA